MFDPIDPILQTWQTILTLAVHHPWIPLVVVMIFLGLEQFINWLDQKKHPTE